MGMGQHGCFCDVGTDVRLAKMGMLLKLSLQVSVSTQKA